MKRPHLLSATAIFAALGLFAACAATPAQPVALTAEAPAAATVADARFTIAVIPDTQNYTDYTHQTAEGFPFDAADLFIEQMRWISENLESQGGDIAFVTHVGDVWQHGTLPIDPEHEARGFKAVPNPIFDAHLSPSDKVKTVEMPKAREGFALIAGKTPFSVVPGNHDYDATWTDSKFPPRVTSPAEVDPNDLTSLGMLHAGGLDNFREVFNPDSAFFKDQPWYVASHDGGTDSAQIFEAGGYRFLHIGLQFDPPDTSLVWASSVIDQYEGLPTIVTTHDFLNRKGERVPSPVVDSHAADPDAHNTPQMVWDKFISQNDQIFLVLAGHQHGQSMRVDDNASGQKVWQILADFQDRGQTAKDAGLQSAWPIGIGDGWLRLMTFDFSTDVPSVKVSSYSTHYKKFSREMPEYAAWYRGHEQPEMTDAEFHDADDYTITLEDFRVRFDRSGRAVN